jgi:hypothetical protein
MPLCGRLKWEGLIGDRRQNSATLPQPLNFPENNTHHENRRLQGFILIYNSL